MAQLPSWQSLDAGVPIPNGSGAGCIVALVASEGAVERGWAGGAALDLARSWGEAGEKVIVVDGALHYPTLHTDADTENFEGLSDAALFGLSVGRVARAIDGGTFFLITAGTAVADANAVARSARWGTLLDGFLEAGVKLLLFVRDGDSGCAAFLGSASDIVVLAERSEGAPAVVRDLEGMVRAVVGPGAGEVAAAPAHGGIPRVEVGEERAVAGPGGRPHGPRSARPPEEWTFSGPGGRQRVAILAILVVLLLLVLLAIFGVIPMGPSLEPIGALPLLSPSPGPVLG